MPRQARKKSNSGIYHVMLRGINQQQIFVDSEDYEKFLQILKDCKEISEYEMYAYCLMGNHIHLLIKPKAEPLEQIFKRICGRFVYWYNIKYQRIGPLFQDRFKSEPVENDAYFLMVIRYIHQNPAKSGICKNIGNYDYSSYKEYVSTAEMVSTEFVFDMITKDEFIRYNADNNNDECLDIDKKMINIRLTDEQAKKEIIKISKCQDVTEFQIINESLKPRLIIRLHKKGMSIRQISRLTGTSKGLVEKWLKDS